MKPIKTKVKGIIWVIILICVLFFIIGCKPKQIITEKVVTKVDSTAVITLQNELNKRDSITESLIAQLERTIEEITKMENETSSHTIIYDTTAQVIPETGKYPVLQEVKTNTKSQLEKTISEMEKLQQDYNKKISSLEDEKSNLSSTVEMQKNENKQLKEKTVPTFNLKSFFIGFSAGLIISVAVFLFIKFK